ncbi:MAG TPA: hypothetical protein VL625_09670 [Patescibacteria group bacterium]|jgi:hypothetical protein|nr:hypothetical protein [Patescibacteria group bacterium]
MSITEGFHSGSGADIPPPTNGAPLADRLMEWAHVLMWEPPHEEMPPPPPSRHLRTDRPTEEHARRIGGQGFASLCRDGLNDQRLQKPSRRLRGAAVGDADLNAAEMVLRTPHVPVLKDF